MSTIQGALSAHYFVFFATMGVYFPYMPAWMQSRGLNGFEIGAVTALMPAMSVISPPLLGMLADALGFRGALMRLAAIGAVLSVGTLAVIVYVDAAIGFWLLFFCVLGLTFCRNPIAQMADVVALESGGDYGRTRLWGSIGFMLAAPLAGRWVALDPAWLLPFCVMLGLIAVAVVSLWLPRRATLPPRPAIGEARRLLRHGPFRLLLLSAALGQAAHAAYDLCITLHLRDLGASGTVVGFAWAIGTAAEVLLMAFTGSLFRRWSVSSWLVAALLAGAIRWGFLALVADVSAILITQPLHGLTFGIRWVCGMTLMRTFAGGGTLGTAQGLYLACFSAGGVGGMLAWGAVYDASGGAVMFAAASVLATVAAVATLPLGTVARRAEARVSPQR